MERTPHIWWILVSGLRNNLYLQCLLVLLWLSNGDMLTSIKSLELHPQDHRVLLSKNNYNEKKCFKLYCFQIYSHGFCKHYSSTNVPRLEETMHNGENGFQVMVCSTVKYGGPAVNYSSLSHMCLLILYNCSIKGRACRQNWSFAMG